ncbi:MAG: ROK family protein [Planctomycetota bacterium]
MNRRLLCGVDLGGTSAKVVLANQEGELVSSHSFSTQNEGTPEAVLPQLVDSIQEMLAPLDATGIGGLGMGVPGLVDVESGTTRFLPNLPTQWRGVEVGKRLREALRCPVRLMNDVRTATLGELRFGCGRDEPRVTFAFFSLGTGIGGGVVIDGKVRLGALGAAGELGHQTVAPDGPRCGCGNRGCLETLASGPAITAAGVRLMRSGLAPKLRTLTGGNADLVTPAQMALAANDDALVAEAIDDAARWIGLAAANVVVILHPDRIVLGGGVAEMGSRLTVPVKEEITRRVGMFPTDEVRVECSTLGDRAGLMGAIALAIEASED